MSTVPARRRGLRNRYPRAVRRWSWTCDCGAPARYGMKAGPQYVDEDGAAAALESHRGDHAAAATAAPAGTLIDHGPGPHAPEVPV